MEKLAKSLTLGSTGWKTVMLGVLGMLELQQLCRLLLEIVDWLVQTPCWVEQQTCAR